MHIYICICYIYKILYVNLWNFNESTYNFLLLGSATYVHMMSTQRAASYRALAAGIGSALRGARQHLPWNDPQLVRVKALLAELEAELRPKKEVPAKEQLDEAPGGAG